MTQQTHTILFDRSDKLAKKGDVKFQSFDRKLAFRGVIYVPVDVAADRDSIEVKVKL